MKWSATWLLKVEPSDPVPCTVKVKVPFTVLPFWLNPPHVVNLPASFGRLVSSRGSATKVPVAVNVAWTRPSSNTVSCSIRLLVVVMA